MDWARWIWRAVMGVVLAVLLMQRPWWEAVAVSLIWTRLEFMDNGIQGAWQNIGVVVHQMNQVVAVLKGPKSTGPMVHKPGGVPIPGIRKVN